MRNCIIGMVIAIAHISTAPVRSIASETSSLCKESDTVCRDFEKLANAEQFDKIIGKVTKAEDYSKESRYYIAKAYLGLASADSNTPEQEEAFCRKALAFGAHQAYMGLYFIYAQKNEEQALGFLKEYIKTKPVDSVPYVILGESELGNKNYQLADTYLRESKKVSRANSPRVDWMLFQTNYLLGNYQFASEMLETALKNGKFDAELKKLSSDARFNGMGKRPEFKKYEPKITAANQ
jgi:tetratricopeptide (TPR) repeat protein